jgi:hypothetical protein
MKMIFSVVLHLIRLFLSKTTQRKVEYERDEIDDGSPPRLADGTGPFPREVPALAIVAAPGGSSVVDQVETEEPYVPPLPPRLPSLSVGTDGWLVGEKVVKVPSERCYSWKSKSGKPLGALWHWTATAHGTALTMAKRTVKRPGTSVHLWIEHDGTIYQSAPMTRSTGHAGGDSARRVREEGGTVVFDPKASLSVNGFLLGIEIVCVGEVRRVMKIADGSYEKASPAVLGAIYMGWPFGRWGKNESGKKVVEKGPIVKNDQVTAAVDEMGIKRFYQDYTSAQVDAAERLVRAWRDKYGWTDAQMAWGHIDSDPSRKVDPGPLWRKRWLPAIFDRIAKEP